MESLINKECEFETFVGLINLLNENNDLKQTIKVTTRFLKEWVQCEAVGIRFNDGDDFPYFETIGFLPEFVELENHLCTRDLKGQIKKDKIGNPILECMCGNIICGRYDTSKTFFTEKGSFWSNCTSDLLANTTAADRQSNTRNRCNGAGYESVALIPLRTGNVTFGLIQLNDKKKNKFTPGIISLLEKFAITISIALSKQITTNALKESDKRYRSTLDNMLEGAQIIDFNWRYIYVNDTFVEHSKYSREVLLSHTVLELYPGIENTSIYNDYLQCFNERKPVHLENKFIFPDKSEGWFDLSFQPVPEGIFILSVDITGRKHAVIELEEHNNKLLKMNKELEQFAYLTSHDLQEPLKTLTCFAELIQKEYSGKLKGNGEKYLEFILKSSDRMKNLIKGLLDYSRIGKEKILTRIDCNDIVSEVLSDINFQIEECKAKITVNNLPVINGYNTEIRQLFQNLISNALKFRKQDRLPEIEIKTDKQDKKWRFSIRDNGIGIEQNDKEKIFKIFKRIHNRNVYEGTGIGLAFCEKIVELHKGSIWVDSKINEGSIFYFTI